MIEMPVRENNCCGRSFAAESLFSHFKNAPRGSRQAGIDKHPGTAVCIVNEVGIDDSMRDPRKTGGDFFNRSVLSLFERLLWGTYAVR